MARLESQMENMMGYPAVRDPSIIDPITGKPYDDSSRMRQQAEITRQADAMEEFQPVELPEYLKTKVEEKQSSPASEVSTDKLKTAYDALVIPKKPLKRDSKGRPLESLRPKLRPTKDFGPSFNFKSPIDKTIELNYLLRDPKAKTKSKEIVSGLSEKTKEGERAIQGFYDSVAKGQGLSATENAWCAAFVHYILTELGADTLKGYKGQRARKYINYGSPVDDVKNAQEGDIVIFDWNGDGRGDHVAFYAGTRITDQDNPNKISVVGGNQNDKVTLMTQNMNKVLGIRRITKNDINVKLSKDLAKNNPIFKLFVPAKDSAKDINLNQGPQISNTQQADPFSVIPSSFNEGGSVTSPYKRGHPSTMPADDYYDMQARQDEDKQTEEAFVEPTVPFFDRPMDSDESDRIVGQDDAGNLVRKTALGNTYTVSRNPDQRTTRTKVTDAADAFLENPRLPTKDEVVGAGKAALEGAVDVVSTPKRLLTGEQSPTETQMGDVFDVSVGTGIIGATQKLPENALGMFMGRYAKNLPEGDIKNAFQADMIGQDTGTLNELGELVPTDFGNPEDQDLGMLIGMVQNGADLPKTKQAILDAGWSEGKDGKYRWELNDQDAQVDKSKFTMLSQADILSAINAPLANVNYSELGDVLDHFKLYENYPDLKTMPVFVDTDLTGTNTAGYFNRSEGYLAVAQDQLNNSQELKRTLLHEIMHKIQQKEDFDSGTNALSDEVRKIYDSRANAPEAKAAWAKYDQDIAKYDFDHIPKSLDLFRNVIKFSEDNNLNYGNPPFIEYVKSKFVDSIRASNMARVARRDLGPNSSEYKRLLQFAIDTSTGNILTVMRRFSRLMEANERGALGPRSKRIAQDYRDTFKDLPILEDGSLMFNSQNIGTQLLGLEQPLLPDYINPNATPTQISADKQLIYRSKSGEVEAANVEYRMDFLDGERDFNKPEETEFGATGFDRDEQWTEEQARALPNTYAQGGLTSMNDQTQMAFALGGEAETVDPVSGNDVPPGSLPEEVRDDIDARLSEGEYVVPADVVRYFGVKFFEDLRTQAKMGLQQMDADGRIGGDPIPPEDSMDVAELKEELSKSDMYAGGLTDGGGLDTFIDDASRSPMVNGRMRANGATVKMAVGGLAVGNYGDVTKVDGIIQKLMTAANKDPALMEKLASKGIMINKTGADKKSAEMKQANKPEEPLKAAEGVSVQPNPFDFDSFNTLGGNLFKAAGIKDPNKTIADTFLKEEGTIEQIVLIAPDGTEIPVAWNTAMAIPPGFTKKATNEYGAAPTASATSGVPVAISTQDTRPRKTGDDGDNGGGDPPPTATPFNYRGSTPEALADKYRQVKTFANIGRVAAVAAGPLGVIIGIGARINHDIVMRRIEQELDRRIKEEEIKPEDVLKNPKGEINTIQKLMNEVDTKNVRGKGFIGSFLAPAVDSFFDKMATTAADKITAEVVDKSALNNTDTETNTGLKKITAIKAKQDADDTRRFEKEERERKEREAAAKRAQEAAQAAATAEFDRYARENIKDRDDYSTASVSGPLSTSLRPSYRPSSTSYTGPGTGRLDTKTGKTNRAYGGRNTGGLVSIPAAKKQKKRTTQRRKGLGTRP